MNRHNSFICSILLIPANQTNKLTNCMPTVRYDLDMRCRRWPTCTLPQSSTPQIKWPIDLTDQTLIENCRWRSYFIPPRISFTSEYLETLLGTMDLAPTGMTRKTHLSGWIAQESLFCPPLAKSPGNATQQPMIWRKLMRWFLHMVLMGWKYNSKFSKYILLTFALSAVTLHYHHTSTSHHSPTAAQYT